MTESAAGRLNEELPVERLASRANMSPRTFARRFLHETGTSSHQWVTYRRLMAAQRRLETTPDSIDRIAEAVGFGSAETLRQHFRGQLKTTPTAYRRRFSLRG